MRSEFARRDEAKILTHHRVTSVPIIHRSTTSRSVLNANHQNYRPIKARGYYVRAEIDSPVLDKDHRPF